MMPKRQYGVQVWRIVRNRTALGGFLLERGRWMHRFTVTMRRPDTFRVEYGEHHATKEAAERSMRSWQQRQPIEVRRPT